MKVGGGSSWLGRICLLEIGSSGVLTPWPNASLLVLKDIFVWAIAPLFSSWGTGFVNFISLAKSSIEKRSCGPIVHA